MPWLERQQQASFENQPINGLAFLHGDVVARQYQQEWVRGKKYPLISYPSGISREAFAQDETANILLFGDVTLPYAVTRVQALQSLNEHPHQTRLRVQNFVGSSFEVINSETHRGYRLSFDARSNELSNLDCLPEYAMEVLPGELRGLLPPLYSTEQQGGNAIAPIKFFTPDANWTWYPTEFDGHDLFFGLVSGFELETGYFTLTELEQVRGGLNLPIERDLYFEPQTIDELRAYHN